MSFMFDFIWIMHWPTQI